jgi:hypothetical protein
MEPIIVHRIMRTLTPAESIRYDDKRKEGGVRFAQFVCSLLKVPTDWSWKSIEFDVRTQVPGYYTVILSRSSAPLTEVSPGGFVLPTERPIVYEDVTLPMTKDARKKAKTKTKRTAR